MVPRSVILMGSIIALAAIAILLVLALRTTPPDPEPQMDPAILNASIDALTVLYHEYPIPLGMNFSLSEDREPEPVLCVDLLSETRCMVGIYRRDLVVDHQGRERTMGFLYANESAIETFLGSFDDYHALEYHLADSADLITRTQPPVELERFVWVRTSTGGLIGADSTVVHSVLMQHSNLTPVLFYVFERDGYGIDRQLTVFGSSLEEHASTLSRLDLALG